MQEQIEAVHRMQDYIEANLFNNITLANLASASLFSPWYSYRLFTNHVGITPADYIRKLRLSKSALKLRDSSCKIADGFDVIELPATKYLMFQGEPFAEEDFMQAIEEVQVSIKKYDPSTIGYSWDKKNPRIQLEPIGTRGYIELLPIN